MRLIKIILADDKERHLRFPLSETKVIKQKYGKLYPPTEEETKAGVNLFQTPVMKAITNDPEEALPYLLMQGLVEKDGLTEQLIASELIDGPMQDEVTLKVVEAFFGQRQVAALTNLRNVQDAMVQKMVNTAIADLTKTPGSTVQ